MEVNLSDEHNNILPYFVIDQLFMQQSQYFGVRGYIKMPIHANKAIECPVKKHKSYYSGKKTTYYEGSVIDLSRKQNDIWSSLGQRENS